MQDLLEPKKAGLLILNASEVVTVSNHILPNKPKSGSRFDELGIYKDGAVAIIGERIAAVGDTRILREKFQNAEKIIDATGKTVLPGFIDPHTHLVFAGSRHEEYREKIAGLTYEEIAAKDINSGIFYTVEMTRRASKEELVQKGLKDLDAMMKHGTTTVEIKSGYGLDMDSELKILEVIKELFEKHPADIIPTFLAHAFPPETDDRFAYCLFIISMLHALVGEWHSCEGLKEKRLAEFFDIFCDPLGFDIYETRNLLTAAEELGFKLKIHAEQTGWMGGSFVAAAFKVTSADHLDYINQRGIKKMADAGVIAVLLPTVTFHLMEMVANPKKKNTIAKPFWPSKVSKMIKAGIPIALATDYNPGSSPNLSMQMVMQCAARLYRMSLAQIINAATINAAFAVDRGEKIGSLESGKQADIIICDCPSHENLIDSFGHNLVETVIKNGKIVVS